MITFAKTGFVEKGRVVKAAGRWYTVDTEDHRKIRCAIKGSFRIRGIRLSNPVVVGDFVTFEPDPSGETGLITHVESRKNYIIRKSANLSYEAQIIAANIDQAFLIVSLVKPRTLLPFIDRFLVAAEAYRIPVTLVFNKTDLYGEKELEELETLTNLYRNIGYKILHTSVPLKLNLEKFKDMLTSHVSLLSGNSGVGKSSLINAVEPTLQLKTKPVSEYHKTGKHTTTYAEMFSLNFGGYIIDTPGIRGFGLVDTDKNEIYHFFPEIFKAAANCSFYNCTHTHEPGCAVREAVEKGEIALSRYNSYLDLFFDKEKKYR